MYRKVLITAVLLAALVAPSGAEQNSAPPVVPTRDTAQSAELVKQLQQLYANYNAALLQKKGHEAASLLHPNIVNIYAQALELARSAEAEELKRAPAHKRLIAFYLRWKAPAAVVASSDARDVIAFMVHEGVLRSDVAVSTDLRDFELEETQATANLYAQGKKTPVRVRFAPVDGAWKIDLTDLQRMADDIYAQTATLQKISEDQALLRLVEANTGKPVTEAIWVPISVRDSGG